MGKSTVARRFAMHGAAVYDADAAVAALYAPGGAAVAVIGDLSPEAVIDGAVDRQILKARIAKEHVFLKRLEAAVHPLVAADRDRFTKEALEKRTVMAVYDVPLLFEVGLHHEMDRNIVVSADAGVQRARALARPGMTEADLNHIIARQMSDAEKRRLADVVIDTNGELEQTYQQVDQIFENWLEIETGVN